MNSNNTLVCYKLERPKHIQVKPRKIYFVHTIHRKYQIILVGNWEISYGHAKFRAIWVWDEFFEDRYIALNVVLTYLASSCNESEWYSKSADGVFMVRHVRFNFYR